MESKHDSAFLEILREEKNVASFLDSFFGFLYRCSDFYVEATSPDEKIGFPSGVSEDLVVNTLRKWKNIKRFSENPVHLPMHIDIPPASIQEVTVSSDVQSDTKSSEESSKKSSEAQKSSRSSKNSKGTTSECYNGAAYDAYSWSQSISDLDVIVRLPETIKTSKEVRVEIKSDELEVAVLKPVTDDAIDDDANVKKWESVVKGRFSFKIKSTQSYWCLEPGKHVNLHLEKTQERWWDALMDSEPRIELSKIDCSRNLEEMGESEQMKVEELMWNQKRKLLGQSTSDQIRMEQILQKAWNADGSPFKGTEYDPSVLKFN